MTTKKLNIGSVVDNLIMVRVTIRRWGGGATAEHVARDVEHQNEANNGAVKVWLRHLPKSIRHEMGTICSRLRAAVNSQSLPWEDGGWRVVRADKYMALVDSIDSHKEDFEKVVDTIVDNYHDIKATAKKNLGKLFQETDFPARGELRIRYGIEINPKPIQTTADIRIKGLSAEAEQMIRKSIEQNLKTQMELAMRSLVDELLSLCNGLNKRIKKVDQKGVHYDAFVKRTHKVCDALRNLNLAGDTSINELIKRTEQTLCQHNGDVLRENETARKKIAKKTESLIDELDNFDLDMEI